MKITNSNIGLVVYRLRKAIINGFETQNLYPTNIKNNSVLRNCGVIDDIKCLLFRVEESQKSIFQNVFVELDISIGDNKKYIRVHNGGKGSNYRAFLIYVGDEIVFNNGLIKIRTSLSHVDSKCFKYITNF